MHLLSNLPIYSHQKLLNTYLTSCNFFVLCHQINGSAKNGINNYANSNTSKLFFNEKSNKFHDL